MHKVHWLKLNCLYDFRVIMIKEHNSLLLSLNLTKPHMLLNVGIIVTAIIAQNGDCFLIRYYHDYIYRFTHQRRYRPINCNVSLLA